jgi:hypothetical protein
MFVFVGSKEFFMRDQYTVEDDGCSRTISTCSPTAQEGMNRIEAIFVEVNAGLY